MKLFEDKMQGGADGVPICSDLCACFLLEQVVYVLEALEKSIISIIYHKNEYMSHA